MGKTQILLKVSVNDLFAILKLLFLLFPKHAFLKLLYAFTGRTVLMINQNDLCRIRQHFHCCKYNILKTLYKSGLRCIFVLMYKWKNYDFGYVCVNLCLFPQLNVDTFSTKRKKKSCRPCIYSFMEKSFFFFKFPYSCSSIPLLKSSEVSNRLQG